MNMTRRFLIFAYGLVSYLLFLAVFIYTIGFLGNFAVPKSIDSPPTIPLWQALLVNFGLLLVFALQHSVMARPAFKRWWTRFIPQPAERSTYVLFSNVALILMFALWQPMGGMVWRLESPFASGLAYTVFAAGCLIVLA